MTETGEKFTAYITKYALTSGIKARSAKVVGTGTVRVRNGTARAAYYFTPDWHRTREEAEARAEEMRVKKIASLKKQLARLEALRFGA